MRIKFVIPFAFGDLDMSSRAAQISSAALDPDTKVEIVPARNTANLVENYYEAMLFDMYLAEAGLTAEEEGYDALIMDTVSDSGLYALRSRLSIPVIGPGLASYCVAMMLGKKFSIITIWDSLIHLYEKTLDTYHLWEKCASIRSINIPKDFAAMSSGEETLFTSAEQELFERLTAEAQKAIDEDGADIILLGSTTMHKATDYMSDHLDAPVINPGPVAIKLAETIVQLGLSHSEVAFPTPTTIQDGKFFSLVSAGEEVATT